MRFTKYALATFAATATAPWTSASNCNKYSDKYGCGACYKETGYCERQSGDDCHCCCNDEDGNGLHGNTCDGGTIGQHNRGMAKGCNSCMGYLACNGASNSLIGDDSCHGSDEACKDMVDSFIKHDSCHGDTSCKEMKNTTVGANSCEGVSACYQVEDSTIGDNSCHLQLDMDGYSCSWMKNTHVGTNSCEGSSTCSQVEDSTIGDYSCQDNRACRNLKNSNIGDGSCKKSFSCDATWSFGDYGVGVTIGKNSCNKESMVCSYCENDSVVPDNSCNEGESDTTYTAAGGGYSMCNYCHVSTIHHFHFCFVSLSTITNHHFLLQIVRIPQH
jgi:hypothetical protein